MAIDLKRIAYKIEFQPPLFETKKKDRTCLYPPILQDAWVRAIKNDFAPDGAFRYYQLLQDFKGIFHDALVSFNDSLRHITDFAEYYRDNPEGIGQLIYQRMPGLAGNPEVKLLASDACHRFIDLYMYKRMHAGLFLRLLTDSAQVNSLLIGKLKSGDLWNIIKHSRYSTHLRQAIKFWSCKEESVITQHANLVVENEFLIRRKAHYVSETWSQAFRRSLISGGKPVFVNQFSRA